jgi:hypothetical protein
MCDLFRGECHALKGRLNRRRSRLGDCAHVWRRSHPIAARKGRAMLSRALRIWRCSP